MRGFSWLNRAHKISRSKFLLRTQFNFIVKVNNLLLLLAYHQIKCSFLIIYLISPRLRRLCDELHQVRARREWSWQWTEAEVIVSDSWADARFIFKSTTEINSSPGDFAVTHFKNSWHEKNSIAHRTPSGEIQSLHVQILELCWLQAGKHSFCFET